MSFLLNLIQMISSKKFWEFKHTRSHKKLKSENIKVDVIRTFTFNKSFLLEIKCKEKTNSKYVIPYRFMSNTWPYGFYTGLSGDGLVNFTDDDIVNVINE